MLSEKLTHRLCRLMQDHHEHSGFKLEYLEAWTSQRGHRISRPTISRVLNGKVSRMRRETAEQLAAFLEAETGGQLKAREILADAVRARAQRRKRAVRYPISTVAGNGTFDYNGDHILAAHAYLFRPCSVCSTADGTLYIADQYNHRIREITPKGVIETLAGCGTGKTTFRGDGGPPGHALLHYPYGVCLDGAGDLYIADRANHRIRKIDMQARTISTIVGNGEMGYAGNGGPAPAATLNVPRRVQVDDAGHIYFTDNRNNCVRRVDAATGIIETVAGTGRPGIIGDGGPATEAELYAPIGLALAPDGDLYIADTFNNRVCKVDAETGIIATVVGTGDEGFSGDGGLATQAQLQKPFELAFDGAGHLFIADTRNHRVRRVDAATGHVTTVAGTGVIGYNEDGIEAADAHLNEPQGICFNAAGDLFIAEVYNSRIRKVKGVGVPRA